MTSPNEREKDGEAIDEQLVAYLDGELDAEARRLIEQRLVEDAAARSRLGDFQRAWDLLDELPSIQTDQSFTQTTVELVATKAAEEAESQQNRLRLQGRRGLWIGLAVLGAAVVAGYFMIAAVVASSQNRFLRDLAVAENMDLYRHAESIDFLKQLDREGLFPADEVTAAAAPSGQLFTQFDLASLRRRADELTPVEKKQLERKRQRFERLEPSVRDQMRKLHASVAVADEPWRLLHVMAQYQEWLKTLTPADRSQLLELPADSRLARIGTIKAQEEAERFRSLVKVSPEDGHAIWDWFTDFVQKHEAEVLREVPKEKRQEIERAEGLRRRFALMRSIISPDVVQALPQPDRGDIEQLAQKLSPDARAALIAEEDTGKQLELIRAWARARDATRRRPPEVSQQELERFYREYREEIDQKERSELENLPPDDFRRRLRWLYFRRYMRGGGPRHGSPPPPGRLDFRGGPRPPEGPPDGPDREPRPGGPGRGQSDEDFSRREPRPRPDSP
jgi:hypothetical protein